MSTNLLLSALDKAVATVQLDALTTWGPVIQNVLAAIKANPALITDPVNFVLQGGAIEAEILKEFPNFEQKAVTDLAQQVQDLLTTLAAQYKTTLENQVTPPAATPVPSSEPTAQPA